MSGLTAFEIAADATWMGDINPGVAFARSANEHPEKVLARQRIIDAFASPEYGLPTGLMLTMPGTGWRFERQMMSVQPWFSFVSVEREQNIYLAAMKKVPGWPSAKAVNRRPLRYRQGPSYAPIVIQTPSVRRFARCSAESLMLSPESIFGVDAVRYYFTAAWLDFCGPLTVRRAAAIEAFLRQHCVDAPVRLALTWLNGKWDLKSQARWGSDRWSGIERWLRDELGGTIIDQHRYMTGVPMHQMIADVPGGAR